MADEAQSGWHESADEVCSDRAEAASHLAGPVVGGVAAGGALATAFAEAEAPPAALATLLAADGAYEAGHHIGDTYVAPVFQGAEYGACETANFLGEEAHHAAHALFDLFDHPAPEPVPQEPTAPAWSQDMSFSAPDPSSGGGGLFSSLFDTSSTHSAFDSFSPSHSAFDAFASTFSSPAFDSTSTAHDSFSSGFGSNSHDSGGSHGGHHDSGTGMGGEGIM